MTSKERCIALMEYIVEENQGYFDKKRIGNDLTTILTDLEKLEKQDKILNALLKNADYHYDEWCGMRGNQCIMICITEHNEYFDDIKEMFYGK